MIIFTKKAEAKNYREFKKVFLRIKELRSKESFQDLDMTAGILFGIAQEKYLSRKITRSQRETLAELIEGVWQERNDYLEEEQRGKEYWLDPLQVIDLDAEAAE